MAWMCEGRKRYIDKVTDRMDDAFTELVQCMHDLEGCCGCKAQAKKLDTIVGKLENVMHELHDKTKV